jgi:hypothetical protein
LWPSTWSSSRTSRATADTAPADEAAADDAALKEAARVAPHLHPYLPRCPPSCRGVFAKAALDLSGDHLGLAGAYLNPTASRPARAAIGLRHLQRFRHSFGIFENPYCAPA